MFKRIAGAVAVTIVSCIIADIWNTSETRAKLIAKRTQ